MAKLTAMTQTIESSNQTLDRIITKVEKKSENPILPIVTLVEKESSDRDFSEFSLTLNVTTVKDIYMLLPTVQRQLKSPKLENRM